MNIKNFAELLFNNKDIMGEIKLELDKIKNNKEFEQFYKENREIVNLLEEIVKDY